ncbi:MAG: glycosyltransferase family 2 protein [Candidatus Sumerlaeaceae bacterium]|nr:glycosyltransferase family 2 protein [Candidatus Sumerlaeaceae bacterium]
MSSPKPLGNNLHGGALRLCVIIPGYNAAKYLPDCLGGLAANEFDSWECIYVDDASEDGSAEIAESHGARVIRNRVGRGCAFSRNRAARNTSAEILVFVDADVVAGPTVLQQFSDAFERHPEAAAIYGSYDDSPRAPAILSSFRNLLHHYVHQQSPVKSQGLWTGLGAIRRSDYFDVGGQRHLSWLQDVDQGIRMNQAGKTILVLREIQGTHLKEWKLGNFLYTDVFARALPWTVMMHRNRAAFDELNLSTGHKLSALLTIGILAGGLAGFFSWYSWIFVAVCVGLFVGINAGFYRLMFSKRGLFFAVAATPYFLLHYLCALTGFVLGKLVIAFGNFLPRQSKGREGLFRL